MRDMRDMDIAKNIRMIEWLKTELLDNVSGLFRGFIKGNESVLLDCLSNIVVFAYVLSIYTGKRAPTLIPRKRYAHGKTGPAQSLFKKGLAILSATLLMFDQFIQHLSVVFRRSRKHRFHFVQ